MKKLKLYLLVLIVAALVLGLSCLAFMLYLIHAKHIDVYSVEELNLNIVMNAIGCYRLDHGGLPPDESFRDELADYFEDDSILYEIKYFHQGNEFVLVSPGKNKKFDTPEGFENIEKFEGESDDLILFSPFDRRPKDKH